MEKCHVDVEAIYLQAHLDKTIYLIKCILTGKLSLAEDTGCGTIRVYSKTFYHIFT